MGEKKILKKAMIITMKQLRDRGVSGKRKKFASIQ